MLKNNKIKQVALVTGGANGIGRSIAVALAKEGYDIVISDIKDNADDAMAECMQNGAKALFIQSDISDSFSRKSIISRIKSEFGCLNVLVNNAGVAPKVRDDILESSEESYDRVMSINLKGPHFLTQLAANWMIELGKNDKHYKACIINISSVSAETASPSRAEYCISKAGLSMTTKLWAARLGEFSIPVYEIRPGIIQTDMTACVKEKYDKLISEGLLIQPRWGMPEDVAKVVAALARGDLAYSTGQTIYVDGGMNIPRL